MIASGMFLYMRRLARLFSYYVFIRLLKTICLMLFVALYAIGLTRYVEVHQREWQPRKFLHLTQMSVDLEAGNPAPRRGSRYVCMDVYQGGLGNRMFQFAAVFVAAASANKTVEINVQDALLLPFETTNKAYYFYRCVGRTVEERYPCAYDERLLKRSAAEGAVRLRGYWQSWKYFRHHELDLRRQFTFSRHIQRTRDKFVHHFSNYTRIGVHVRRGDMLEPHYAQYGYQLPSPAYFKRAMNWFRQRFQNAVFIVCSNNISYAKEIFRDANDVFYSEEHTPAEDLAILASCKHVIMSVGTFGWWAGWLAGGQTIYYSKFARPGSQFDKVFVADDFFPPTWIGMT